MTLTEAAFWTRRFGVVILGVFVITFTIIVIITLNQSTNMLAQYLTANYACTDKGTEFLKYKLEIPSLKLGDNSDMFFELKTDTGKIDALPDIINVYKFDNPTQSLSSQSEAKLLAKKIGFDPNTVIRRGTESYVWTDRTSHKTLEIQAKNLNFSLITDTKYVKSISDGKSLPTEQEAKSMASNILRSLGFSSEDYSEGNHQTTLIKINPDGTFKQASSLSEADLIRVDFMRSKSMITIPSNIVGAEAMVTELKKRLTEPKVETPIINNEKISVYTFNTDVTFLNPSKSNISVYVGVKDSNALNNGIENIYQIDYTYRPIQTSACGTYELITPEAATQAVQSGKGSLVYLNDIDGDVVVDYNPRKVKKFTIFYVNLTYYENPDEQEYLQPVYVISGEVIFDNDTKGEFDFYYPAINYNNVTDKIELPKPETKSSSTGLL